MTDALFSDPRLAGVYDAFDAPRDDLAAYVALVEERGARRVVDVGCGTGTLALLLAQRGCSVVGVDPAEASLAVARAKPGAGSVTWVHGDATSLGPGVADLALMTGNVAQVFLTDAAWSATLQALHGALRTGGHLVLEARRPERRAWEDWAADPGPVVRDVAGVGEVEQRREVTEVDLPLVSFRHRYAFSRDGAVVASESTLRFRSRAEIEDSLVANGFVVDDVRDAPDRPGMEHVFLAHRA